MLLNVLHIYLAVGLKFIPQKTNFVLYLTNKDKILYIHCELMLLSLVVIVETLSTLLAEPSCVDHSSQEY